MDYSNLNLIVFTAEWCSGCKTLYNTLESEQFKSLHVQYMDIDLVEPQIVHDYGVRSLPTGIITDKDGNELHRFTGGKLPAALEAILEKYVQNTFNKPVDNTINLD